MKKFWNTQVTVGILITSYIVAGFIDVAVKFFSN